MNKSNNVTQQEIKVERLTRVRECVLSATQFNVTVKNAECLHNEASADIEYLILSELILLRIELPRVAVRLHNAIDELINVDDIHSQLISEEDTNEEAIESACDSLVDCWKAFTEEFNKWVSDKRRGTNKVGTLKVVK
ncbi:MULTISPECIES: hypothetical protein [unclassified Bacillus cereus group]|uniref:hypothetical protein n=1 Tax=unclassified Bacillus cereus group TaxID=2750818 RepID=UPI000C322549|nr:MULTISPECIES: hypothetical protein [unclassified Bacillus cereus group]MDA1588997.1 hypothetical protein [Bacillus cereus group sp. TH225LC]PKF96664.1 hypothetical protein CW365_27565 [Bacillus cereus]